MNPRFFAYHARLLPLDCSRPFEALQFGWFPNDLRFSGTSKNSADNEIFEIFFLNEWNEFIAIAYHICNRFLMFPSLHV